MLPLLKANNGSKIVAIPIFFLQEKPEKMFFFKRTPISNVQSIGTKSSAECKVTMISIQVSIEQNCEKC